MSNSNFINGQEIMNDYENVNMNNLNNEIMKTFGVGILGKIEMMQMFMKEKFENLDNRMKKIEDSVRNVKMCKDLKLEDDFRDVELACDRIEALRVTQEAMEDFIEKVDDKNEEIWAKKIV